MNAILWLIVLLAALIAFGYVLAQPNYSEVEPIAEDWKDVSLGDMKKPSQQ
jgi:septal ring-binding cell division protein DamX